MAAVHGSFTRKHQTFAKFKVKRSYSFCARRLSFFYCSKMIFRLAQDNEIGKLSLCLCTLFTCICLFVVLGTIFFQNICQHCFQFFIPNMFCTMKYFKRRHIKRVTSPLLSLSLPSNFPLHFRFLCVEAKLLDFRSWFLMLRIDAHLMI